MSKVAELRTRAGLTQRELANRIGIDVSTLRNWETGRGGIDALVRFVKLCKELDCDPGDLYESQDLTTN